MPKGGFDNKPSFLTNVAENALGQVSGILSTKPTAKYTSGARTIIKINNRLAGFAFSISWRINTEVKEIKTIDDYMPYELVPTRVTVEGTIGAFHIPGQSVTKDLTQANMLSFLFHKYITIEVRDSATDALLFKTNKAFITSRSEDLTAEQLGKVQLSFKAIGWLDEGDTKAPDGYDDPNFQDSNDSNSAGARIVNKARQVFGI